MENKTDDAVLVQIDNAGPGMLFGGKAWGLLNGFRSKRQEQVIRKAMFISSTKENEFKVAQTPDGYFYLFSSGHDCYGMLPVIGVVVTIRNRE